MEKEQIIKTNGQDSFVPVRFNPPHIPDQSELRQYQKECIDAVCACESGSHLVVLPTGAGKTFCFSHIPRHGRVLILSHRDELVHQPRKYYDCSFGVEQADERSNGEEVVSASVQSLARRLKRFHPDEFDMIITDEAHHATASSYQKIYEYFNPRIHIGFTATPDRNDKADLHKIFEDIIYMKDMKWAIKEGFLTDIDCFQVDVKYNLSNVKTQMGDFQMSSLSDAMMQKECIGAVVEAYNRFRKGQTLIFAVNVAHAHALASRIEGARVVTGETKNRDEIIKDFTDRKFPCMVNCMIFTEGTDIPLIETVIMARPTQNQSLYTQMVGRGLRLYPGKEALRLIDCVGVSKKKPVNVGHLFGLNGEILPPNKRTKLQGCKITEMEDKIAALLDGPDSWINEVARISLFKEENADVDLYNINFVPMGNNSLYLSLGGQRGLTIHRADALGETTAVLTNGTGKHQTVVKTFPKKPLQNVIEDVYAYLLTQEVDSRSLWDARAASYWSVEPASDAQKNYVSGLLSRSRYRNEEIDLDGLTKRQASILIERLKAETENQFNTRKWA